MRLTQEQIEAIELFADGRNLRINAFAGAGKTTTLRKIAEYASARRGLYIPFGKSTATDAAATFPESVECRTQHSLAYRGTPTWARAASSRTRSGEHHGRRNY